MVAGVLQCLDKEGFRRVGVVGGKFAHLVGAPTEGVFVGYGEHLVGLQRGAEGEVAEGSVDGVFGTAQEPRGRQLFVVRPTRKLRDAVQHGRGLFCLSGCRIVGDHRLILAVGRVGRGC